MPISPPARRQTFQGESGASAAAAKLFAYSLKAVLAAFRNQAKTTIDDAQKGTPEQKDKREELLRRNCGNGANQKSLAPVETTSARVCVDPMISWPSQVSTVPAAT